MKILKLMFLWKQAFRENGLNTMEAGTLVNRARLETLLSSLYSNLNKRLPPGQNINIEKVNSRHFGQKPPFWNKSTSLKLVHDFETNPRF
jgi:hypothetical protein